jgi:H+/Na+-translocating ferredoxin:NAD+ oxidoreductase subunit E
MTEAQSAWTDGLWRNNPALVQLLGLCPLLAVTTTFVNGLMLGLATAAVLLLTNVAISSMRAVLVPVVRIPLFVLIIASLVTSIDLLTSALFFELHETLGLFIPLIITNCAILAQAETVASRRPVMYSAASALATGAGFAAVLVTLGSVREVLGSGTLFAGMDLLLGPRASGLAMNFGYDGMLIAILPPGAFFGLAALLALRNWLLARESS